MHSQSHELRELEKQLAAVDRKLTALDGHAIASQQADVAAPPSSTDNEQRRTLESQLSAAQKKLDDLRARYTDEYPDVESPKDDITEIRQKLASLPPVSNEADRAASPPKPDADANETDQLRLERARLMEAILVEKRREAGRRGRLRRVWEIRPRPCRQFLHPSRGSAYSSVTKSRRGTDLATSLQTGAARGRCRLGSKRERLIVVLAIGGDTLGTSVFGCCNVAIPAY